MNSVLRAVLACVAAALLAPAAQAQSGQMRIVFPFAPGGGGDATARILADELQKSLGQTVLVENRTGGAGRIGVNAVKNAAPDGTTLLFTPFAAVTIYPYVYRSLDYDPFGDLVPITQVCTITFGLAVRADFPARTPSELVAWLKANPGKAQYGSPGAGALPHFFGLMFGRAAGVEMTHIAYKGTAPAIADLLGGQIPIVSSPASDFIELHRAGKIRVIATADTERVPQLPDVPTFRESGIDIVGTGWYGVFAPARTPPDVVTRVSVTLRSALARPEIRERIVGFGLNPTGTSPAELAAIQRADADKWAPIVKASGFVAD
jgi:tripartite-type tricarboxylate transporter receptor subunit TctC